MNVEQSFIFFCKNISFDIWHIKIPSNPPVMANMANSVLWDVMCQSNWSLSAAPLRLSKHNVRNWPVAGATISCRHQYLQNPLHAVMGVSLDIENYCTLRLLFNQSLVLDKVPEYGKPAKCCSP